MKLHRWVIGILLGCYLVPFVLLNDFFPFFRFGMFAEPVKNSLQTEQFVVLRKQNGYCSELNQYEIGLHKGQLDYLYRNYYYRGESQVLLERIKKMIMFTEPDDTLLLIRVRRKVAKSAADSVIVAKLNLGL